MEEQSPAASANQPLNRHTSTVGAELVSALTVAVRISRAFAIELRTALAEAEKRAVAE